jgi:hypothetical protein
MSFDEKLWVLDKSETFALSGWLTQAETIRRELNRLAFSHWEQIKEEQALSKSILRRYVGYWHTHKALVDREAIGVHAGTYAEELIASIARARVLRRRNTSTPKPLGQDGATRGGYLFALQRKACPRDRSQIGTHERRVEENRDHQGRLQEARPSPYVLAPCNSRRCSGPVTGKSHQ